SLEEARKMLLEVIKNGKALDKFKVFVKNQGGDESVVDNPEKLPQAKYKIDVPALTSGFVSNMVADEIGIAAMLLGAGRATKEDKIDLAVGIMLRKKVGDNVEKGEPILTIYSNRENVEDVKKKIYENISISDHATKPTLIHEVITK
ncbi:pyrimidine-nucleoside phosphorylase, partial [Clostridium estertheticum]|nr:pyrimidine-nucleoside phosphorylase [Clostridium estertheticum]